MRIFVRADDGDQIVVNADDLATEQQLVRLEFSNLAFDDCNEFDSIALTTARARDLAAALLTIADAIDGREVEPNESLIPVSSQELTTCRGIG
jgi:hypothetical protein